MSPHAVAQPRFIVHEIAHAFQNSMEESLLRVFGGMKHKPARESLPAALRVRSGQQGDPYAGFAGGFLDWQWSEDFGSGEVFVDQFVGWTYSTWRTDPLTGRLTPLASLRRDWMDTNMPWCVFWTAWTR